jgi:HD-GYP domain-containing protein (c-di-GMP phosphodiesterase class II)
LRLWVATDPMLSEHHITGSFGVATFPVHGFSAEDIIRVADAGMYVSKKAGGDRVSISEDYGTDQTSTLQRQQVSGYVEGFLQRERTGPEQIDELVATLRKLSSGDEQKNLPLLRDSIEALARAAESRELNSSGHGDAVAQYAEMIGRALGLSGDDLHSLGFIGRVHDVGKILIPEHILNKESALAEEEFHYVKMHPRLGAEIVACVPESELLQRAIECHHERVDGSGYPLGLKGDDISLWARILAVADSYVNLTSDRSLAPGKTSEQALAELEKSSGTKYDGMLVRVLARELKTERSLPGLS